MNSSEYPQSYAHHANVNWHPKRTVVSVSARLRGQDTSYAPGPGRLARRVIPPFALIGDIRPCPESEANRKTCFPCSCSHFDPTRKSNGQFCCDAKQRPVAFSFI